MRNQSFCIAKMVCSGIAIENLGKLILAQTQRMKPLKARA